MENSLNDLVPHPQFLEVLFTFKNQVSTVFKDVLGIHEIDHIALTRIYQNKQLLTLSSTPAMEFNLFNGSLWRYDHSYHPKWFKSCTQDYWQNLYTHTRYDELYYLKQIKHAFPLGLSMAAKIDDYFVIYSMASKKSCAHTRELFVSQLDDFYKIGQYCFNMLNHLFSQYDTLLPYNLPRQVEYEASE